MHGNALAQLPESNSLSGMHSKFSKCIVSTDRELAPLIRGSFEKTIISGSYIEGVVA